MYGCPAHGLETPLLALSFSPQACMQAQAEASLLAGQLAEERAQRQRLEGFREAW
mgnify:CR=1 FL=1